MKQELLQTLYACGVLPVITIGQAKHAEPLADALASGGLPCAEITFRTAAAADAIAGITHTHPDFLVGAGTVLTPDAAARAIDAGASFIVSPGLNPEVVHYCTNHNVPVIPGCMTPSDIERALSLGLSAVKFFPAEAAGGLSMLRSLSAPYPALRFMPTGGIDNHNIGEYLSFSPVIACGGSYIATASLIEQEQFVQITANAAKAVRTVHGFSVAHVGINTTDPQTAEKSAAQMASLFALPVEDGGKGLFAGGIAEFMKAPGRGTHGHIAIGVFDVDRACAYLQMRGAKPDESSRITDEKGTKFIYLNDEFCGFSVHLTRKERI